MIEKTEKTTRTAARPKAGSEESKSWRLSPIQNIVNLQFGGLAVEFFDKAT